MFGCFVRVSLLFLGEKGAHTAEFENDRCIAVGTQSNNRTEKYLHNALIWYWVWPAD